MKKKPSMKGKARKRTQQSVIILVVICAAIFAAFPLVWALICSLIPEKNLLNFSMFASGATLKHYVDLFYFTDFAVYLKNSIIIGLISTALCTGVATSAGYSFTRFKNRWHLERLMVLIYIIPPVLLVIPIFIIFKTMHLINSYLGVALGHATFMLPFATLLMIAFFENIPKHLDEAALIDGCTRIGVLTRVILPLSLPGIVSTAIIVFAFSWNDYLYAYTLTSLPVMRTLPLGIAQFSQSQYTQWGMLMAAAVITTLPVLIFFVFIQKRLMEGLIFSPSTYK